MMVLRLLIPLSLYKTGGTVISKTVEQFQGHVLNVYYYNNTLKELNNLTQLYTGQHSVYMINLDLNNIPFESYKPDGFRHVHLFLLKNFFGLKFSNFKVNFRDIILILIKTHLTKPQIRHICKIDGLEKGGGVFIFGSNSSILNCCYYCNKEKVSWNEVKLEANLPSLTRFVGNFTDFGGYRFKIGFSEFLPFFYCSYSKENTCEYHGPEYQILEALSKALNFDYKLIEYSEDKNSSAWKIMMEKINYGEIDWAISGITQTSVRSKVLDFTRYIKIEQYMAIYKSYDDGWMTAVQLLHTTYAYSWAIGIAVAVTAISVTLLVKLSTKIFKGFDISLQDCVMMTVTCVMEQPISENLQKRLHFCKPCIKLIILLWWLFSSCITTSSKSQLTSILMTSPTDPSDAEDLVSRGFGFEIHRDDFYFLKFHCENSTSEVCRKMLQATVSINICGSVLRALYKKVAFISDGLPLQYVALRRCNLTLEQKYSLNIVTAKAIGTEWHAWPLKKHTPYVNALSRIISILDASGLMKYWYQKPLGIFREIKPKDYLHESLLRPLNLNHFIFPFTMFLVGNTVSILVCLVEIFYPHYSL